MKNISVKEIVCPHVYKKYGDRAIKFLDRDLIAVIEVIRNDILKSPIYINNGSTLTQRGLRCNICDLCSTKTKNNKMYLSGHVLGRALDFTCKDYTPDEVRSLILNNANLLPCKIRMESAIDAPTWVHIDTVVAEDQTDKVYVFRA